MNNKIIIFLGPSASGKDTIAKHFEKMYGYSFVVSTTTRPIRNGESEGNPYFFVSNQYFEDLIKQNKLIEYREYDTLVKNKPEKWFYGVEKTQVLDNTKYVAVLDMVGLREFKKYFGDRVISFYINVPDDERKRRCLIRGDFDEYEWNRRLQDDKIKFSQEVIRNEINHSIDGHKNTLLIVNDIIKILKK